MVSNWAWSKTTRSSAGRSLSSCTARSNADSSSGVIRRWRDKVGVARARHPVLGAANLARSPRRAAGSAEQAGVYLGQQAHPDRQAIAAVQLGPRVVRGVDVAADLLDIGVGRGGVGLDLEQVHQRRLRSLDLHREYGLLADERVREPVDGRWTGRDHRPLRRSRWVGWVRSLSSLSRT